MVGFITVDRSVHFWKLVPKLQMIVLPDVNNVFEPLPHSAYLANYSTNYEVRTIQPSTQSQLTDLLPPS